MNVRISALLATSLALGLSASSASAQIASYSEDFESMNQADSGALANAGWLVFGNVFDPSGGYLYGYGPYPAPNGGAGFCGIDIGQGGPDQGNQQHVVYNDYNNGDHANGNYVEANVFQEQIVGAGDVGKTFTFRFDAKLGNLLAPGTAQAFIKVIDSTTFGMDAFVSYDTTNLPVTWGTYSISLTIDANHVGDYFQIGYSNYATNYDPTGIFYDNLSLSDGAACGTQYCGASQNPNNSAFISIDTCDSTSASINLTLSNGPSGQFTYLLVGDGNSTVSAPPGANGDLCIVGGACLGRYDKDVGAIDGSGLFSTDILNAISDPCAGAVNIDPGATWNFQYWHRSPGGQPATFSEAVSVTFN